VKIFDLLIHSSVRIPREHIPCQSPAWVTCNECCEHWSTGFRETRCGLWELNILLLLNFSHQQYHRAAAQARNCVSWWTIERYIASFKVIFLRRLKVIWRLRETCWSNKWWNTTAWEDTSTSSHSTNYIKICKLLSFGTIKCSVCWYCRTLHCSLFVGIAGSCTVHSFVGIAEHCTVHSCCWYCRTLQRSLMFVGIAGPCTVPACLLVSQDPTVFPHVCWYCRTLRCSHIVGIAGPCTVHSFCYYCRTLQCSLMFVGIAGPCSFHSYRWYCKRLCYSLAESYSVSCYRFFARSPWYERIMGSWCLFPCFISQTT